MKRVPLGLADYTASFYCGESEYKAYGRLHEKTTGSTIPDFDGGCHGRACLNGIWVLNKDDAAIIAHELIHLLVIVHAHMGIREESPNELLAYQHTYLMRAFMI